MMNSHHRTMGDLFGQLGLPDDDASIRSFIQLHHPMDNRLRLADAPFWTDSQAAFIKEKLSEDGDWSQLIDTLSSQLRDCSDAASETAAPEAVNEGEGNVTAARRYNAAVQNHLAVHDVGAEARRAQPNGPQEAAALLSAEAQGASKAKR